MEKISLDPKDNNVWDWLMMIESLNTETQKNPPINHKTKTIG